LGSPFWVKKPTVKGPHKKMGQKPVRLIPQNEKVKKTSGKKKEEEKKKKDQKRKTGGGEGWVGKGKIRRVS